MKCKKSFGIPVILSLCGVFAPLNCAIQQACAAETVTQTTVTETSPVVPVYVSPSVVTRTERVTETTAVRPPVVIDVHTGSKVPQVINLAVGQQLLFKGNNTLELATARFHQVFMYYNHDGFDALKETPMKGYKAAFRAVAPGNTKLQVEWNTIGIGCFPWGAHPQITVCVAPAETFRSVAETTEVRQ
jgi:hypothetical protein